MRMTFRDIVIAVVFSVVLVAGCDLVLMQTKTEKVSKGISVNAPVVTEAADTIAGAVEDATGKPLVSKETAEKGSGIADNVTTGAGYASKGLEVIRPLIPEDKRAYADIAMAGLAGLTALSGGVAEFFRRRAKKSDKMATAIMVGANAAPGSGKLIVERAKVMGVAQEVENKYQSLKTEGSVG